VLELVLVDEEVEVEVVCEVDVEVDDDVDELVEDDVVEVEVLVLVVDTPDPLPQLWVVGSVALPASQTSSVKVGLVALPYAPQRPGFGAA